MTEAPYEGLRVLHCKNYLKAQHFEENLTFSSVQKKKMYLLRTLEN